MIEMVVWLVVIAAFVFRALKTERDTGRTLCGGQRSGKKIRRKARGV